MPSANSPAGIDRLRAVTLGVTDLGRSVGFYTRIWGLEPVAEREGSVFLKAAGRDHHVLVLQRSGAPGLVSVTLGAPDRAALQGLYLRLQAAGVETEMAPRELKSPGGGWGFAFHDPEGRVFKVVADREDLAVAPLAQTRPLKLAHVVMNSVDSTAVSRFFTEVVGFRLSDRTAMMHFLRCNADHHAIAFAQTGNTSLNHLAFEMASWNELMFGVGRLKEAGCPVHWGVGRHGPGDNVFAYFLDPDGLAIEYTAEVQKIDETRTASVRPRSGCVRPTAWTNGGHADPASAALKHAMHGGDAHHPIQPLTAPEKP
jgi:catechol 2,3-dioxygenase